MLQKIPFEIRRDNPNIETIAAMDELKASSKL
jgi:antitoxin component of RelBE/YafQ-DinJ toxin-antitoxin module